MILFTIPSIAAYGVSQDSSSTGRIRVQRGH
jgi:hypothetical protein